MREPNDIEQAEYYYSQYKKELYRFNTYKKYHLIEVVGNIHENADLIKVGEK